MELELKYRPKPEVAASTGDQFPYTFWMIPKVFLGVWIKGNPPITRPFINQLSCTGEHVEMVRWGLETVILWSWAERPNHSTMNLWHKVMSIDSVWIFFGNFLSLLRTVTESVWIFLGNFLSLLRTVTMSPMALDICLWATFYQLNYLWYFNNWRNPKVKISPSTFLLEYSIKNPCIWTLFVITSILTNLTSLYHL
jgi:hypothetical protein